MLDRLEAERAASAANALSAQEAERARIARELHDEIGQTLTAVLLELKWSPTTRRPRVREELLHVAETTRSSLDEIRRVARRLRPGVLEEFGLVAALKALTNEFATPRLSRAAPHRQRPAAARAATWNWCSTASPRRD